ncbi:penicillin acylase family protein [Alteromonas pelagimontana]|uniref:Penicillin acylase family protein n=1 Tax=Alteromonas pelagimontana TaxID=1858656 RepID=A0A6M4M8G1_9ALTE|nr:penicillin acylase family protein [Alteromonas pelagimontana]QJR79511.1 penicillin acylase family protein [Alteromonas pelagimontana]
MRNWLTRLITGLVVIVFIAGIAIYATLHLSIPALDGEETSPAVSAPLSLERDGLGQAVIHAADRIDAAYALGVAHTQDRFFQMDLQRRVAAGELSVWLGKVALDADKKARFHQFRARAEQIYASLPKTQKALLQTYAKAVNNTLAEYQVRPMEYLLTGYEMQPWQPEDSILVIFSMYLDLQQGQVALDMARTGLVKYFGNDMLAFLNPPSSYQAALDGSIIASGKTEIPSLPKITTAQYRQPEPLDIGSNSWAVTGQLTDNGAAMLANDMHLGLRVPIIWYRTQLNYSRDDQSVQLTGVSLPGVPGVVVGTNNHIAWGFTNANLDNVEWIELDKSTNVTPVQTNIATTEGEESYTFLNSPYGPVKVVDDVQYALAWVAHQPYAVNLAITDLDVVTNVDEALSLASTIGIPTQNMVVVDKSGNAAWTPAGAVTARPTPSNYAIPESQYSSLWQQKENELPRFKNPPSQRLWTANARVVSKEDMPRFGDGGYALGARSQQIRDRLYDYDNFDEARFYAIQLDNEARFLMPWHTLLIQSLNANTSQFAADLQQLSKWQACACADAVGYTLVKKFRQEVMNRLLSPVFQPLEDKGFQTSQLLRQVEPALWQLLEQQPLGWLPAGERDWQQFLVNAYIQARDELFERYSNNNNFSDLAWGKVNALRVEHPFAKQIPLIGSLLNMAEIPAFGDTFMPAVQAEAFGASERFFVQPGHLEEAVMVLPGGQSGHPLSQYYKTGFEDYAAQKPTPLLPGSSIHKRIWLPK